MANSSENVDAALAGMAQVGAPRTPMGTSAIDTAQYPSATDTGRAMLEPRKNTQAADPTLGPTNARAAQPYMNVYGLERNGARYAVTVNTVIPTAPEAGATQASGRIFSSSVNRSRQLFDEGNATSYM